MKHLLSFKLFEAALIDDKVGKEFWFEYHCFESPASADAEVWYRSHQKVLVLKIETEGGGDTPLERGENGEPRTYRVRFSDGFEYDVFEDELLNSPDDFERPDPPKKRYSIKEKLEISEADLKKRWDKKRSAVLNLQDNIQKLRRKVSIDMDSEDEKIKMVATIVRIIDITGERVGNEFSSSDGHFGVAHFMKKHIRIDGNEIKLSYIGKSGVNHTVSFSDSKVARNLKEFMTNNSGEVFVTSSGLSIKNVQVNNYLSNFDITSKDLRGFKVNKLMSEKLRKLKKPETDGEIKRMFNDVLRKVAEEIGHTPAICRKNYLLPEIEEAWYGKKEVQKI
jgi:hypothetical protein